MGAEEEPPQWKKLANGGGLMRRKRGEGERTGPSDVCATDTEDMDGFEKERWLGDVSEEPEWADFSASEG